MINLRRLERRGRNTPRHAMQLRLAFTFIHFVCHNVIVFLDNDIIPNLVKLDQRLLDQHLLVILGRADFAKLLEFELLCLGWVEFWVVEGVRVPHGPLLLFLSIWCTAHNWWLSVIIMIHNLRSYHILFPDAVVV